MPASIMQGLEPKGAVENTPQLFGYAAGSPTGRFSTLQTPMGTPQTAYPSIGEGTGPSATIRWAADPHAVTSADLLRDFFAA